jgi:hypothetical protein
VAVTTSKEDAARIVSGVNASRGLGTDGLDGAPLSEALQVLYEICLYHSDVKFRNHVDRRAGFASLLERADKAWRAFGDEAFQADGATREKDKEAPAEPEADGQGVPKPSKGSGSASAASSAASASAASAAGGAPEPKPVERKTAEAPKRPEPPPATPPAAPGPKKPPPTSGGK